MLLLMTNSIRARPTPWFGIDWKSNASCGFPTFIISFTGMSGSAPRFTSVMNARHVPYGGILLTCAFATFGVGLNAWLPGEAFDIVVNFASLGVVSTWSMIMLCHLVFVRRTRASAAGPDRLVRPSFRLRGWPWVNVLTIVFLVAIVVDMGVDGGTTGAWTIAAIPIIAAVLLVGWVLSRRRLRGAP